MRAFVSGVNDFNVTYDVFKGKNVLRVKLPKDSHKRDMYEKNSNKKLTKSRGIQRKELHGKDKTNMTDKNQNIDGSGEV